MRVCVWPLACIAIGAGEPVFKIETATDAEIQDRVKAMLIKVCGPQFEMKIEDLQRKNPDMNMDLLFDQ